MSPRPVLLLLLHAHLPFVRHPEFDECLEERWLFEAITECYVPLLERFERLADEEVTHRITLSLSPTLLAMLGDPLLQSRYRRHLERLIELADRECRLLRKDVARLPLAQFHRDLFRHVRDLYQERYRGDLVRAFRRLETGGGLELITCAATHGYLPLLQQVPAAVAAQLRVASAYFTECIGHPAAGVWLPECGYFEGLERDTAAAGYRYFFLETHGVVHARPRPVHGVQSAVACADGTGVFGRDPGCSADVWSAESGYPGHALYREFHRDVGFERDAAHLGTLGPVDGRALATGIKYHRVTDRQRPDKALYDPGAAARQAKAHAADFLRRRARAAAACALRDRPPLFLAPYDAELFGHWWFEGPQWLDQLVRQNAEQGALEMLSASDYLARYSVLPQVQPSPSSWGAGGYSEQWLNPQTAWLYPHLHQAAREMQQLVAAGPAAPPGSLEQRALTQAGRSLLLAQASDWPFILRAGTAVGYATTRLQDSLSRFRYLHQALTGGTIDPRRLEALEQMDNLFPNLDYRVFGAAPPTGLDHGARAGTDGRIAPARKI